MQAPTVHTKYSLVVQPESESKSEVDSESDDDYDLYDSKPEGSLLLRISVYLLVIVCRLTSETLPSTVKQTTPPMRLS